MSPSMAAMALSGSSSGCSRPSDKSLTKRITSSRGAMNLAIRAAVAPIRARRSAVSVDACPPVVALLASAISARNCPSPAGCGRCGRSNRPARPASRPATAWPGGYAAALQRRRFRRGRGPCPRPPVPRRQNGLAGFSPGRAAPRRITAGTGRQAPPPEPSRRGPPARSGGASGGQGRSRGWHRGAAWTSAGTSGGGCCGRSGPRAHG